MITEDDLHALVGTRFPGGSYTPQPYVNWLTCDCVMASEILQNGGVHPLLIYMGTQAGMGLTLEELFALCAASSEDGPMLGEWGMDIAAPMHLDRRYTISGGITGTSRKRGEKTGVFDIVQFELELREEDDPDTVVAVTRSSFIYPRRD
ncbi:MAG: hypothetical protein ACK5MP_12130 [Nostocoides sp.]